MVIDHQNSIVCNLALGGLGNIVGNFQHYLLYAQWLGISHFYFSWFPYNSKTPYRLTSLFNFQLLSEYLGIELTEIGVEEYLELLQPSLLENDGGSVRTLIRFIDGVASYIPPYSDKIPLSYARKIIAEKVPYKTFAAFRPVARLKDKIDGFFEERLKGDVVGVTVRSNTNPRCLRSTPDKFFAQLDKHRYDRIFLASDDASCETPFKNLPVVSYPKRQPVRWGRYGYRKRSIILQDWEESVADLFLLSKCPVIIASFGSTFCKMAARLGNKPLIYAI